MTNDLESAPPKDFIDALAEHVAMQIPIKDLYQDAASPGIKQVGHLVSDIASTMRLALVPFQFGAYYQRRLEAFLLNSIDRVEDSRRIAPPPQILGPVLEGIRYEPEGTPIDQLFSNLLSSSMDRDRVGDAHPSFPHIIRQLSKDDALLIRFLAGCDRYGFNLNRDWNDKWAPEDNRERVNSLKQQMACPDNVEVYVDRLEQLGLAETGLVTKLPPPMRLEVRSNWQDENLFVAKTYRYNISEIGKQFVRACMPDLSFPDDTSPIHVEIHPTKEK